MGGEDRGKERKEGGKVKREGGREGKRQNERESFQSYPRLAPNSSHNPLK